MLASWAHIKRDAAQENESRIVLTMLRGHSAARKRDEVPQARISSSKRRFEKRRLFLLTAVHKIVGLVMAHAYLGLTANLVREAGTTLSALVVKPKLQTTCPSR